MTGSALENPHLQALWLLSKPTKIEPSIPPTVTTMESFRYKVDYRTFQPGSTPRPCPQPKRLGATRRVLSVKQI